jgi:hypothetical protein
MTAGHFAGVGGTYTLADHSPTLGDRPTEERP